MKNLANLNLLSVSIFDAEAVTSSKSAKSVNERLAKMSENIYWSKKLGPENEVSPYFWQYSHFMSSLHLFML